MKKLLVLILTFIIIAFSCLPAFADFTEQIDEDESISISSDKVYFFSLDEGNTVLYEKNADVRTDPASLVKLVVGILVLKECSDTSSRIICPEDTIDRIRAKGVYSYGFKAEEDVSVLDLLYAMIILNANDACSILVDKVLGGEEACVKKMNDYASSLGCTNTSFSNPNGFAGPEQYTTAKDFALIYSDCIKNGTFSDIVCSQEHKFEETNKHYAETYLTDYLALLGGYKSYYNKYTNGGRYANREDDMCNVACTSSYDGYNYCCIILGSKIIRDGEYKEKTCLTDAKTLFTWVHSKIILDTIITTDKYYGECPVKYSSKYDFVSLYAANTITTLVPVGTKDSSVYVEIDESTMPEAITKSIKKGEKICVANVKYADTIIAQVDLVAGFDVGVNPVKYVTGFISDFVKTTVFRVLICIIIFLIFVGIYVGILKANKKRKEDTYASRKKN